MDALAFRHHVAEVDADAEAHPAGGGLVEEGGLAEVGAEVGIEIKDDEISR